MPDADTTGHRGPCWQLPETDHHLGPRWLALACVIAGQRPIAIDGPLRVAVLGCRSGALSVDIARRHPHAAVWAWDPLPDHVESTRHLRDQAEFANLTVHERPGLPDDLGGGVIGGEPLGGGVLDLVVIDQVLDVADDALREQLVRAVGSNLRPGGVVGVRYHTVVGWTEITPVLTLMRQVAARVHGPAETRVRSVLDVVHALRAGDAKYLTMRPIVGAWIDSLADLDPATIDALYLRRELRPLSHAEVSAAMEHIGGHFVGSARLTDELDLDLPDALAQRISSAPTRVLRETLRDLAVRRTDRIDVFRLADAPLRPRERTRAVEMLAPSVAAPSVWSPDEERNLRIELERSGSW